MIENTFDMVGTIIFDPPNITGKHEKQSSWKKVAIIEFNGDVKKYYRWFIKKRYNLVLGESIRKAHVTIINDKKSEMDINKWDSVKNKWHKQKIKVKLSTDVRSDGINWWLVVPEKARKEIQSIRDELSLGRPYFGLHMTFGVARDSKNKSYDDNNIPKATIKNEEHSKYILRLIKKGIILS